MTFCPSKPGLIDRAFLCLVINPVGAGLLAKAVYQSKLRWLTHRIREQARSHTSCVVIKQLITSGIN